jgi:hypothetical protein
MAERIPASEKEKVISEQNRTTVIFSNLKEDVDNPIEIVWDSLDQALYLMERRTKTTHRIYPSLVPGAPTVAAQISNLKEGYKPTELPEGNEIKVSIYDLDTLYVEFTNKVYLKSFGGSLLSDLLSDSADISNDITTIDGPATTRGVSNVYLSAIPQGNIRSGRLTSQGSGYVSTTTLEINSSIGAGNGAQLNITATPTVVTGGSIVRSGDGLDNFTNPFTGSVYGDTIGTGLLLELTHDGGILTSATILSGGSNYQVGEVLTIDRGNANSTFAIESVDGGSVISAELVSGGQGFSLGEVIDLEGGTGAQFTVSEVMLVGPEIGYDVSVGSAFAEEVKADSVYFTLDETLDYSTTYLVTLEDVYNLAYESTTHEELITTIDAPAACAPIESITFEAYGSGEQTLYTKTEQEWVKSHSDTDFIYYYGGLTWEEFSEKFGDLLTVPDSVTPPDTVYVYYKDGSFLLEDASWVVGIIGSETGYEPTKSDVLDLIYNKRLNSQRAQSVNKTITSGFEWVLYSIDIIGEGYQLTPAGSSTYECGVSDWGGNWGDSIQQFKLNRTLISEN